MGAVALTAAANITGRSAARQKPSLWVRLRGASGVTSRRAEPRPPTRADHSSHPWLTVVPPYPGAHRMDTADVFERLKAKQMELEKMRRAIAELQSLEESAVRFSAHPTTTHTRRLSNAPTLFDLNPRPSLVCRWLRRPRLRQCQSPHLRRLRRLHRRRPRGLLQATSTWKASMPSSRS